MTHYMERTELMYLEELGIIDVKLPAEGRSYRKILRGKFEAWAKHQSAELVAFLRRNPNTWVAYNE